MQKIITFIHFRLKRKLDAKEAKKLNFFCLDAKWVSMKRNEKLMKRNKAKNNGNFISLLLEAKNSVRKKGKGSEKFQRIFPFNKQNACETDLFSFFASFRREGKIFFSVKPAHPTVETQGFTKKEKKPTFFFAISSLWSRERLLCSTYVQRTHH
jgi:hypothetical protein